MRKVGDTFVIVPTGTVALDFHGIMTLNETGAFLWKLLKDGVSLDQLKYEMVEAYEVSEQQAQQDIQTFMQTLEKANVFE